MIPEKLFLQAEFLLEAYSHGAFPMGMDNGEIGWFSPDPRGIIPLEGFHLPHGLARRLKRNPFEIRLDTAFEEVMRACADRDKTWITEEILASYCNLHQLGFAHSVESWLEGKLVGGLYGVAIGGAFFGESMFHTATDASKVALHALVTHLRKRGFGLLDTQWLTPHLATFGGIEIPRTRYLGMLRAQVKRNCAF